MTVIKTHARARTRSTLVVGGLLTAAAVAAYSVVVSRTFFCLRKSRAATK